MWNVPSLSRLSFVLVIFVSSAGAAFAAEKEPKKQNWAATELAEVDDDFPFQGEYVGSLRTSGPVAATSAGLQVIAMGHGNFQAVLFPGGLPGAGWDGKTRIALGGTRTGNALELQGSTWKGTVRAGTAVLTGADAANGSGVLTKTFRRSPTEGLVRPEWGTSLYDDFWKMGFKNARKTKDRLLMVGTETKYPLSDFRLHLEFRLPYMPYARGQGRSNSGVYLHSRYEVQILDSFGLEGKNNECGSLYTYQPPKVNMCYPPLSWQTYDVDFRSARFDRAGKKSKNARLTVWHNGVVVQDDFSIERKTGAGQPEGPLPLPTKLQDHGNPVHFRNVWVVDYAAAVPEIGNPTLPAPPVGPSNYVRP